MCASPGDAAGGLDNDRGGVNSNECASNWGWPLDEELASARE